MKKPRKKRPKQGLPNKLEPDVLLDLVQRYRAGDQTAREPIINGHLRLARKIAGSLIKFNTKHSAYYDLQGEAWLALVKAVDNAPNRLEDDNITPYIKSSVRWACRRFLQSNHVLPIPTRTLIRSKGQLKTFKREPSLEDLAETTVNPVLIELIESCAESPVEMEILKQRIEGYTDSEIATHFGRSREYVTKIRSRVQDRFEVKEREFFRTRSKTKKAAA